MSQSAVNVELALRLKDGATAGLKSVTQTAVQSSEKTSAAAVAAATKSSKAAEESASRMSSVAVAAANKFVMSQKDMTAAAIAARKRIEQAQTESSKRQVETDKTAHGKYVLNMEARRTLGMRSEKEIQKEIAQTESAYQRLAKSGVVSARELARAQDASIAKIKVLRREMGEIEKAEKSFSRMQLLTGVGAAAGVGMMLKPAVTKAVNYDHTVASLTNTMFNDRDKAGRNAGKAEVKQAIDEALKVGGGTREQAAGTLSALMGSGEFSKVQSYNLLGTLQKGATATGADPEQLANIALAAKRMGVKPEDMDKAISKAIRAGELGGFELTDMAKHLPAALSSARSLGLSGMGGFERVLASMQASVLTAGTKDEAANNLINILEKMNSSDTAKDFKKHGIDLRGELVKGTYRNEDAITTFIPLIDRVIAKDTNSKAVTQELERLSKIAEDKKNPQREQALKQVQQIYASSEIGKFLQDRQALQGFRAESQGNTSGLVATVREGLTRDDKGQELDTSYGVMSDTASSKLQQIENAKLQGQDTMMTGAGSAMKPFFDGVVRASTEFPVLTAAVSAATVALGLLTASAAANAMFNKNGTGNGSGGAAPGGKSTNGGTKSSRMMGKFGIAAAVGGAVLSSVGNEESAAVRYGSAALSGAGLGAMFGPIGAVIGAAGGLAIQGIMDGLKHQEQKPNESILKLDLNLPPGVTIKKQLQSSVGNTTLHTAVGNLWVGAPR